MTRKEQINLYLKERNIPITSLEANSIIEGIEWADEHPNLYNNEKYHTVKVSCLDELNRKAVLYDEFLEKACEWIKNNKHSHKVLSFGSLSTDWDKFIREFRKAME